jgi:uncharacterized RDD family membrane protein YckC
VSIAAGRPRVGRGAHAAPVAVGEAAVAAASPPAGPYAGLLTRALAFALDVAVIDLVAIATAAVVALGLSALKLPQDVKTIVIAVGGGAYVVWSVGYFVTFWATTGQTPGSRVLRIRVRAAQGGPLRPRRALLRFAGLVFAAVPLFAGFLLILLDDRRRGLQDRLARTVVVDVQEDDEAGRRRGRGRE